MIAERDWSMEAGLVSGRFFLVLGHGTNAVSILGARGKQLGFEPPAAHLRNNIA